MQLISVAVATEMKFGFWQGENEERNRSPRRPVKERRFESRRIETVAVATDHEN